MVSIRLQFSLMKCVSCNEECISNVFNQHIDGRWSGFVTNKNVWKLSYFHRNVLVMVPLTDVCWLQFRMAYCFSN